MSEHHTPKSVFEIFKHIDAGHYTNAHFSNSNVVMLSKEHYDTLTEAFERIKELKIEK